ncbi:MAG: hypothetical protein KC912_22790 [Proteobacteria bacterium]|nr:hypothetical protein [Pseudomonadota bacterium]
MFRTALLLGAALLSGCAAPVSVDLASDESTARTADFEAGKWVMGPSPSFRSQGYTAMGPSTAGLSGSTAVWDAPQRWYSVTDEAGLAWDANSGLTWDEKYAAWVDSLAQTVSEDGHATVELETPWGRTLASPRLECAEMAMFLRVTFASWHGLPFYMTAWTSSGDVHFGHFGIVDASGNRLSGYPNFANSYSDHTAAFAGMSDADVLLGWPDDASLEDDQLTSQGDDAVAFLGADAYAGAYFDELFLNKRAGHFLMRLLVNFGSMHLASARNTWNLDPHALREGDLLLQRWQSQGIGHTVVVKEIDELAGGNLDVEVIYGSMPRIQPVWYPVSIAKSYFTSDKSGGPGMSSEGMPYSELGGGLKRWRTPIVMNGAWQNIVPVSDRDSWIGSTDYPALEARIQTFSEILGPMSPTEQRDGLLERIRIARDNLAARPASCANRTRREEAFDELYTLMADEWGITRAEVDETYRELEDYVFAELEYSASKTCCWNSSTDVMWQAAMDYNVEQIEAAHAAGQCEEVTVFKASNGGYEPFRQFALDRGDAWVAWSADEACPQANVLDDAESSAPFSAFCDVEDAVMGWDEPTCTPSAEVCGDAIDNDCDGIVDDGCTTGGGTDTGTGTGTDTGSSSDDGPSCGGCGGRRADPRGVAFLFGLGGLGLGFRRR